LFSHHALHLNIIKIGSFVCLLAIFIFIFFHIRFSRWNVLEAFIEKLQLDCIVFFGKAVREKKGAKLFAWGKLSLFPLLLYHFIFSCHEVFSLLNILLFCIQILYEGKIFTCKSYTTGKERISKALIARNGIKSLETFFLTFSLFSLYCNLWYVGFIDFERISGLFYLEDFRAFKNKGLNNSLDIAWSFLTNLS